jgi:hypothetical protein
MYYARWYIRRIGDDGVVQFVEPYLLYYPLYKKAINYINQLFLLYKTVSIDSVHEESILFIQRPDVYTKIRYLPKNVIVIFCAFSICVLYIMKHNYNQVWVTGRRLSSIDDWNENERATFIVNTFLVFKAAKYNYKQCPNCILPYVRDPPKKGGTRRRNKRKIRRVTTRSRKSARPRKILNNEK